MNSELFGEVIQGVKTVARVKAFLVLPVAALHFSVVTGCVGADEFVPDAQFDGSGLKQRGQISLAVGKAVGEFNAIVGLDTLHPDAPAGVPLDQPFQKICGGIGGLLRVGSQEAQACKLINGGVLEQAQLRVRNAPAGYYFHIHLNTLARISHLFVRLGFIRFFLLGSRKQAQLSHDPEQAFRAAGIATFPQPVPQLHHTQIRVAATHIPDQFQLRLRMLVGMAVGTSGLTGQRCHTSIPAGLPEVDVRPALVVFPAGTADAVFFCVFHQGLPICHVLCYTRAHEGYGPPFVKLSVATQL